MRRFIHIETIDLKPLFSLPACFEKKKPKLKFLF